MIRRQITGNLDRLLEILPLRVKDNIEEYGEFDRLVAVVMDLGRSLNYSR